MESAEAAPLAGLHKRTNAKDVTYEEFVSKFARRQASYIFLVTLGIFIAVGAVAYMTTDGLPRVLAAGIGVALSFAGAAGFLFNWQAHGEYLDHGFGITTTETYQPRPAAPPENVRPFVASQNSDGRTTNTGRLNFPPAVWRDLFDRALSNGGVITRDGAQAARVGRDWYHGAGWGALQEELTRLGFIDGRNRLTPTALAWYEAQIPLPLAALPVRSRVERTNGERTANERGEMGEWGEQ